ncbi:holo-ACP synthase [Pajaroellobacter abortibovis]|uniref:Holo-[acyl-carrier-protein] synthase n=1 Tax=Pajaroellobacter abortibovis TaxID=1882918 RepID=A0A1L6MVS1_9BACT|nr:holo-ACP synthase [Pajaroellobacter abortibovis]APR99505.1 holo-[acyl-carrier-protein] synthase [Pajaroellobacter abortibovis]
MIVGIGLDVCSIPRIRNALEKYGERFYDRICTQAERRDLIGREQATALAGRFAAKEAFAKALDGALGVGWHDVQVLRATNGKPILHLEGAALSLVRIRCAVRWYVTLTHDAGIAAAVVLLEGEP